MRARARARTGVLHGNDLVSNRRAPGRERDRSRTGTTTGLSGVSRIWEVHYALEGRIARWTEAARVLSDAAGCIQMRRRRGRIILRRPLERIFRRRVGLLRLETLDDACPLILNSDAHARFRRGRASVCEIARLTDCYSYIWPGYNYRGELSFYLENKRAFVRTVASRARAPAWRVKRVGM